MSENIFYIGGIVTSNAEAREMQNIIKNSKVGYKFRNISKEKVK